MAVPPLGGDIVTIVAMLKESTDTIYLGADSQWTDSEGLKNFKTKITVLNSQENIIAWATAGNPEIGVVEFGNWARGYQRTETTTWESFIREAAGEFARLNRIRREIGEKGGHEADDRAWERENLCQMLMCGWLNQKSAGYFVGNDGNYQSLDIHGFQTIGSGAPFAEAVYATPIYYLKRLDLTQQQIFDSLMEITSHYAAQWRQRRDQIMPGFRPWRGLPRGSLSKE